MGADWADHTRRPVPAAAGGAEPGRLEHTVAVQGDRHGVAGADEGPGHGVSTEGLVVTLIGHLHVVPAVPGLLDPHIRVICLVIVIVWVIRQLQTEAGERELEGRRSCDSPHLEIMSKIQCQD